MEVSYAGVSFSLFFAVALTQDGARNGKSIQAKSVHLSR